MNAVYMASDFPKITKVGRKDQFRVFFRDQLFRGVTPVQCYPVELEYRMFPFYFNL